MNCLCDKTHVIHLTMDDMKILTFTFQRTAPVKFAVDGVECLDATPYFDFIRTELLTFNAPCADDYDSDVDDPYSTLDAMDSILLRKYVLEIDPVPTINLHLHTSPINVGYWDNDSLKDLARIMENMLDVLQILHENTIYKCGYGQGLADANEYIFFYESGFVTNNNKYDEYEYTDYNIERLHKNNHLLNIQKNYDQRDDPSISIYIDGKEIGCIGNGEMPDECIWQTVDALCVMFNIVDRPGCESTYVLK